MSYRNCNTDPELRKIFTGKPEYVINFMFYIAEEVREMMASLGFRTVSEMIGHTEKIIPTRLSDHFKARGLDLTKPYLKQLLCTKLIAQNKRTGSWFTKST